MSFVLLRKGHFYPAKVQPQAHLLAMLYQHDQVGEVWLSFLQGISFYPLYSQASMKSKRSFL